MKRLRRGRPSHAQPLVRAPARAGRLTLRVPDHTTLSRRAATLEVPRSASGSTDAGGNAAPLHLLVDSTGLKLFGAGEWLIEKHGADAATGQIAASALTSRDVDDGAQTGPLLDQVTGQ